jgi:hypothetical protein
VKNLSLFLLFFTLVALQPLQAQSRGGGGSGFSFGVIGGFTNSEQEHLNTLRSRANIRAGGIAASDLDRAWEFGAFLQWRASFIAFQLRPTFFTQSEGSGLYEYSTSGQTVAGIFKIYPLESAEMGLYFQTGVVWGTLETKIKEDTYSSTSDGSSLGYLVGLGVEMRFGPHALMLEGGWRWLPIERNIVSQTTGTPASNSVSQSNKDGELEFDNRDLSTNMSGTQMLVGYSYRF